MDSGSKHTDAQWLGTMGEGYDFPHASKPTLFYAIATTPRSGSSYLAQRLWQTGAMGAPDEYFNCLGPMLRMVARLRPASLGEYADQLFRLRTSPNGVFGFKAHWVDMRFLSVSGLSVLFPKLRFIHIEREDRLAQAVSMVRAQQTGQWNAAAAAKSEPKYNPARIRHWLTRFEEERAGWRQLLRSSRASHVELTYDGFTSDPGGTVESILRQFGLERAAAPPLLPPEPQRQRDDLNREWIERFRRENPDFASSSPEGDARDGHPRARQA